MSDKKDINRRKVLTRAAGVSAAMIGGSAVASAKTHEAGGKLTEEELEAALDAATTRVRTSSSSVGGLRPAATGTTALSATDGPDVFLGAEKNAEIPGGDPFAIETKEEFLQRDVPLHVANAAEPRAMMIPDFYLKETLGEFSIAGYEIEVAVGVGVKVTVSVGEISVSLSVDIFLDIAGVGKFTVTPAGMSFGFSDEGGSAGWCLDAGINPSNLPGLDIELCGNVQLQTDGDTYSVEISAGLGEVCADVYVGEVCVNPPLSASFGTPARELPV